MQRPLGMLAARTISKAYGHRVVLDAVSVALTPGTRTGVVGPNGIGKSTLLRVLAGLEPPDAGRVSREPPTLTVGYLPQEPDARAGETLLQYLARRTGVATAGTELDDLTQRLDGEPHLATAYADALERFLALGGDDLEPRARLVAADLGLRADRLELPLTALSGGESARASLAAILLARFDVFLLDEPTNDLDFDGLERLEGFLAGLRGGAAVVSHDRVFLDRTANRILELAEGVPGAREYAGGWSEYEAERRRERERHYRDYEHYESERDRIVEQRRRMQQWEERGYGQGRRKKKSKDVGKAFEKKLDRLDRVEKPWEPWRLRLELRPSARSGETVARLDRAVVERGAFRLGPLDLAVGRRDRIAIVGANGSGKTTLLRALLGDLPLAAGRRRIGTGVVLGELPQDGGPFSGSEPLLATFAAVSGLASGDARTLLAKFGLGVDDVGRAGSSLSPGERSRATLAVLMARGANLLVLDEPTNHLDLEAIEELEEALDGFDGTVLLVTHDRRLLERFQPTQTIHL